MFISKCNLCNYADDNTLYSTGKDLNWIRRNLEIDFMILHQWFHENHMTLNPGECHYMVIGSVDLSHEIMLNNSKITSSNEEKLLGIFLDSKLNSESNIAFLCRKAGRNINALARLKNYVTSDERNLLLDSVIKSQFTYCPLIWMFTSHYLNNALNNIHERALRLIYNDHEKSFNGILTGNNLKTIHQKNLEFLAIEIYKFQNGLSPTIMNDIFFSRQSIYNLRKFQELSTSTKNTLNFGMETISCRGPQLWNLNSANIKSEPTLELFKKKIRKCICEPCPCRMCKTYLQRIGFIS